MKKLPYVVLWLTTLAAIPAFSQDTHSPIPKTAASTLTKFDLDFPGGSPNELVVAIEKATGLPLNAVVPTAYASLILPPVKMNGVDVRQLFDALNGASNSTQVNVVPAYGSQYIDVSYGFRTQDYPLTDKSIWYFTFKGNTALMKESRFFLLTPYLVRGLTVDDITTAVQTAWKMLDQGPAPELSFHKETKLLIAVGRSDQLGIIEAVLRVLNTPTPPTTAKPNPHS